MVLTGLLLVGHGSKKPYNKELIEKTAKMMSEKSGDYLIRSAFMSINEPSIEDVLEQFRNDQIDRLVVVPLFLADGVHISEDIPRILGLAAGEKKGKFSHASGSIPLFYADPIGNNPMLADLMLESAKNAIEQS